MIGIERQYLSVTLKRRSRVLEMGLQCSPETQLQIDHLGLIENHLEGIDDKGLILANHIDEGGAGLWSGVPCYGKMDENFLFFAFQEQIEGSQEILCQRAEYFFVIEFIEYGVILFQKITQDGCEAIVGQTRIGWIQKADKSAAPSLAGFTLLHRKSNPRN
jgi:hypothetical protein